MVGIKWITVSLKSGGAVASPAPLAPTGLPSGPHTFFHIPSLVHDFALISHFFIEFKVNGVGFG
jgi:hypothetical protein